MGQEESHAQIMNEFTSNLNTLHPQVKLSVVLIGSVARGTQTPNSDTDLLILGDREIHLERKSGKLHVQFMTESVFRSKLRVGDDFSAWCVRFGIPLGSSERWVEIVSSPEAKVWPDWQNKLT